MKLFFIFISLLINFSINSFSQDKSENGWYPFVLTTKLDPDSPANISHQILEVPAGKHGFLKVKNGNFIFEEGTPVKFWGTNLALGAAMATKSQAEIIVDRIAFFGFNIVRLHLMDYAYEPIGIFKDTCPKCPDPQKKRTGILSEEQIDRLDYVVYLLEQRGIYVDMNLLVARRFTTADGFQDAVRTEGYAHAIAMFDPILIALQKQYVKNLLLHYNPYTKKRYVDDPGVALVEVINEESIIGSAESYLFDDPFLRPHKDIIAAYYRRELDQMWSVWLKAKYRGKLNYKRPSYHFLRFLSKEKRQDVNDFYTDLQKLYLDDMLNTLKNEIGLRVPITGIGGAKGKDVPTENNYDFIDFHVYWDHPSFQRSTWNKNDFIINNNSLLLDSSLGIIGTVKNNAKKSLKDKPFTISEWSHCFPNTYIYETPVLMATEQAINKWDALLQFAFVHIVHGLLPLNKLDNYFDIIANPQQLLLDSVGAMVLKQKPEELKEHVSEGIFYLDSPFIKGLSGGIKNKAISLKGMNVKSDQDGAIFIYSKDSFPIEYSSHLILVVVSEVKNSGSSWIGKWFDWGKGPLLLKKISASLQIKSSKFLKAYALDESGKRAKEIPTSVHGGVVSISTDAINSPWIELVDN
jgi:hypothetical protein